MRVHRYSGIRLDPTSHLFAPQFDLICKNATKIGKEIVEEARKEPYFFFDHDKPKTTERLIQEMIFNGEMFFLEKDERIIGYGCFRNVVARRYAYLEVFMLPEFRKHIALGRFKDILYKSAFDKFPEGLELIKLKAHIHPLNEASIKVCTKSGFIQICELFMEGLLGGQLCNILLAELYPKELQSSTQGEIITNGSTTRASTADAISSGDVHIQHSKKSRKQPAKLPKYKSKSAIRS